MNEAWQNVNFPLRLLMVNLMPHVCRKSPGYLSIFTSPSVNCISRSEKVNVKSAFQMKRGEPQGSPLFSISLALLDLGSQKPD